MESIEKALEQLEDEIRVYFADMNPDDARKLTTITDIFLRGVRDCLATPWKDPVYGAAVSGEFLKMARDQFEGLKRQVEQCGGPSNVVVVTPR
ncbi:MAG: hypothetical protein F4X11_07770 [Acidobacteria bacterium]|nr:hypothetical protein [Acidobacteriota bacterium]